MKQFLLTKNYITITQFLKANNYIQSGGESKYFLSEYLVLVNEITCQEKGKKLYANDIIRVLNDEYILKND